MPSFMSMAARSGKEIRLAVGRDEDKAALIFVEPDAKRVKGLPSPLHLTVEREDGKILRLHGPDGLVLIIDAEAELDLRTAKKVGVMTANVLGLSGFEDVDVKVEIDWG